jgi:hypothetical protein
MTTVYHSHILNQKGKNNMKIKTIDVQAKEWFDRINGNTYFSAQITLNYGMKSEKTLHIPYEYGYDSYYEQASLDLLKKEGILKDVGTFGRLSVACENRGIILRSSKVKALKRDVIQWGEVK